MRLLLLSLLFCPVVHGQSFHSGPGPVRVIELFTSQGCSSCPPAERWLGRLADHPQLWQTLFPLAWHVDYWNGLGWPDPFSDPRYSARQRDYARTGRLSQVYTPAVLVQGREWRHWRGGAMPAGSPGAAGELQLDLEGAQLQIRFQADAGLAAHPLQAHVVVLGMGQSTDVPRGENRGRRLREDFVVLAHASQPWPGEAMALPPPRQRSASRYALVGWLSLLDDPAPLQAAGGWIPAEQLPPTP